MILILHEQTLRCPTNLGEDQLGILRNVAGGTALMVLTFRVAAPSRFFERAEGLRLLGFLTPTVQNQISTFTSYPENSQSA
jgi:hypothetical protein